MKTGIREKEERGRQEEQRRKRERR